MGGYLGMNPEDMQQLVTLLNAKANKIEQISGDLTKLVGTTTWDGPDAERFKNEWNSEHRSKLQRVQRALEDISKAARRELDQQRQTSR